MSMQLRFDVDKESVEKVFDKFPEVLGYELDGAMESWLTELLEHALAHKSWRSKSGRLEAAHNPSKAIRKESDLNYSLVIDVREEGADKNYALFLEYGTTKMPPKPWIRPAIDATKNRLNELLEDAKNRAIRRTMERVSVERIPFSRTKVGRMVRVTEAPEGRGAKWREVSTGRFARAPSFWT